MTRPNTHSAEQPMGVSPLPPGTRVGRYVLQQPLGSGTFGHVYAATHEDLRGKRVALKVLHPHLLHTDEVVQRFQNEAHLIAALRHPHIVDVLDIGRQDGVPYIAMEFLEGETLASRLSRDGAIDVAAALDVLLPICSAVSTVHAQGIVHRDLKPENLFLAVSRPRRVQPKLLDFGVAKIRDGSSGMTRAGIAMGTPHFMSPEQAEEARDTDSASDQWSLAVILYYAVTGELPFDGRSTLAVLHSIVHEEPMPPSMARASCPAALDDVVLRAMQKDPRARYPSVRDFAAALIPFASPRAREDWTDEFCSPPTVVVRDELRDSSPALRSDVSTLMLHPLVTQRPPPPDDGAAPARNTLTLSAREVTTLPVPDDVAPRRGRRARQVVGVAASLTLVLVVAAAWAVLRPRAPSRAIVVVASAPLAALRAPSPPVVTEPAVTEPAVTEPAVIAPPEVVVAAPVVRAPPRPVVRRVVTRAPVVRAPPRPVAAPARPVAARPPAAAAHAAPPNATAGGVRVRY